MGNGLGFGFFNSFGDHPFSTQGTVTTMNAAVQEDLMFVGGYSFPIPLPDSLRSTLDLGLSLKLFVQGTMAVSQSILEMSSPPISTGDFSFLLNQPLDLDVGIGLDAGILYFVEQDYLRGYRGAQSLRAGVAHRVFVSDGCLLWDIPVRSLSRGDVLSEVGNPGAIHHEPEAHARLQRYLRFPDPFLPPQRIPFCMSEQA